MNSGYDDMIGLPYPRPSRRKRMALSDRAAQFAPFAALTGYEDGIAEKGRQIKSQGVLGEYQQEVLDQKLQYLMDTAENHPCIIVQYFLQDAIKPGGVCLQISGRLKKIDTAAQLLILDDGTSLPLDQILDVTVTGKSLSY